MVKMILDLDTGIDDSIALFYAAISKEVELLGVTGTYGNVTTEQGVLNSLAILAAAGREDVPVYRGMPHSLKSEKEFFPHEVSSRIHGANGTGNIAFPASKRPVEKESGIDFLISSMKAHPDMTIVTTGPSTNLASALLKAPELSSWQGKVVVMGGALTVRGNVSHFAEANISQDPEAAKIVFESGLDVTMIGLDVTERSRLRREDAKSWRESGSKIGKIFGDMLDYYIDNTLGGDDTYIHDPSAVIAALHPEYFTILQSPLTVETEGVDRGRTLISSERILERDARSKVAVDVDSSKVERELKIISTFLKSRS